MQAVSNHTPCRGTVHPSEWPSEEHASVSGSENWYDCTGTTGVNQDHPSKTRRSAIVFPENFYRVLYLILLFYPSPFLLISFSVLNKLT